MAKKKSTTLALNEVDKEFIDIVKKKMKDKKWVSQNFLGYTAGKFYWLVKAPADYVTESAANLVKALLDDGWCKAEVQFNTKTNTVAGVLLFQSMDTQCVDN